MALRLLGKQNPLRAPTRAPVWSATVYPSYAIEFPGAYGLPANAVVGGPRIKSGPQWKAIADRYWPNSDRTEDLEESFRNDVEAFIAALRKAGATVHVSSTKRHPVRAWLMHHAWNIGKGMAPPEDDPHHTYIDWRHDNSELTRAAAQKMVSRFKMAHPAALESLHIDGKAIDMTISWTTEVLEIENKDGSVTKIETGSKSGENPALAKVGATYRIYKLAGDPPHWSAGRR